mmetsp:Transcript_31436/g.69326  ORF Transcript_31436/g.69326 Transcript_31436/m.69326 type:complete len:268 (+) Transcript_31436:177-980(+)
MLSGASSVHLCFLFLLPYVVHATQRGIDPDELDRQVTRQRHEKPSLAKTFTALEESSSYWQEVVESHHRELAENDMRVTRAHDDVPIIEPRIYSAREAEVEDAVAKENPKHTVSDHHVALAAAKTGTYKRETLEEKAKVADEKAATTAPPHAAQAQLVIERPMHSATRRPDNHAALSQAQGLSGHVVGEDHAAAHKSAGSSLGAVRGHPLEVNKAAGTASFVAAKPTAALRSHAQNAAGSVLKYAAKQRNPSPVQQLRRKLRLQAAW